MNSILAKKCLLKQADDEVVDAAAMHVVLACVNIRCMSREKCFCASCYCLIVCILRAFLLPYCIHTFVYIPAFVCKRHSRESDIPGIGKLQQELRFERRKGDHM